MEGCGRGGGTGRADATRMPNREPETSSFREQEELLPGIPVEIAIRHIATRLSWTTLHTLASVSKSWRQAIRNREVWVARVASNSTETLPLVAYNYCSDPNQDYQGYRRRIVLYSSREEKFYRVPPLPGCSDCKCTDRLNESSNPDCPCSPLGAWDNTCVCLDGKIYLFSIPSGTFVLDVVGHGHWEQRANKRTDWVPWLTCVVVQGKIFASGYSRTKFAVYDPHADHWTPVMTADFVSSLLQLNSGAVVGDEIFWYSGDRPRDGAAVYNVGKNEWRKVDNFDRHQQHQGRDHEDSRRYHHPMTQLDGRLHRICNGDQICVYDVSANMWEVVGLTHALEDEELFKPDVVIAVEKELLSFGRLGGRAYVAKSQGLGRIGSQRLVHWDMKVQSLLDRDRRRSRIRSTSAIEF